MRLGKHFHLSEFCVSQTAARHGISMNPSPGVISNLRSLVTMVMDPLRESVGRPIVVSSGWRPSELNVLVGGSYRSQHCEGKAADFTIPGLSVTEVCHAVDRLNLPYDQLIWEFGSWCHVSYSGTRQRGEALTAKRVGSKTFYSTGLPAR